MSRRGLPEGVQMRHEAHYVETLAASVGAPIGRLMPIDRIDPNPDQPRQYMGDLSELMASIAEKGIIEPIVVRQRGARCHIIAGERRYQAAVRVGLTEVPVIIRDADEAETIELALIENLQRKDLTPFEEAEALAGLAGRFGQTHEQLARRLGKSRTSITESLALHAMPAEIKRLCRLANITSKSLLIEVVRQRTPEAMASLIERLTRGGPATRVQARAASAQRKAGTGRARAFVYQYAAPDKTFNLRVSFRRSRVPRAELIETLESILADLRRSDEA